MQVRRPESESEDLFHQFRGRFHGGRILPRLEDGLRVADLGSHQVLTPSASMLGGQGDQDRRRMHPVRTEAFAQVHFLLEALGAAIAIALKPAEQAAMAIHSPHPVDSGTEIHRPRGATPCAQGTAIQGGEGLQLLLPFLQPWSPGAVAQQVSRDPQPGVGFGPAAGVSGNGHGGMVSLRRMPGPQLADLPADARILAVRMSALGDIVFALPVLDALREALPEARIDWLVEDRHAAVLADHPGISEVLQVPRKQWRNGRGLFTMLGFLRGLKRRGRYDLVLDFQSNLKSGLQMLHVKSGCKVGFAKPVAREGAHRFHHVHAEVPARCHRSERDLMLLRAVGWRGEANFQGHWPLPQEVLTTYDETPQGTVLLHTTTTVYGQDKLWPIPQWAELAQALHEEGAKVQLLWTPADRAKVEEVAVASRGTASLAPATPSLAHLMALSDRAACLIGTDSGPVHLAAYRGTPVVALFGPTDPQVYCPPGEKVAIVYPGTQGEEPPKRDRTRRSPWMDRIDVSMVMDGYQRIRNV